MPFKEMLRFKLFQKKRSALLNWRIRRAFTLVELLIVISLIGILVGISTIVYDNSRDKSRDSHRKQDLTTIRAALAFYFQDNGKYPPADLTAASSYTSNAGVSWIPELTPKYIQKLPLEPKQITGGLLDVLAAPLVATGVPNTYMYVVSADRSTYTLWANLDNANDPDIATKTSASCYLATPPANYNYCAVPSQ